MDGKVRIAVKRAGVNALTVRTPQWATKVAIHKNGNQVNGSRLDDLRAGDEITIHYGMDLRGESADAVQARAGRKALYFGPWLLGASSHDQPEYFNELFADNEIVAGSRRAEYVQLPQPFAVPIAANVWACIPAEFPGEAMKVHLRAVAEQTGYEPARWQTAFKVSPTRVG
jgi:DUF1680 family protein